MPVQQTFSPVDGSLVAERALASAEDLDTALEAAVEAQAAWRHVPLSERCALLSAAVDGLVAQTDAVAGEITQQIGRPIAHSPGEVRGFAERARVMLELAPAALADLPVGPKPGFRRAVRREPLGVVLTLCAWNYPYLIAVNTLVPALAAGNAVLLKHSNQTPLVPERLEAVLRAAGLPAGLFQYLHMSRDRTAEAVADGRVDHVAFTGSVAGGRAVHAAAAGRFKTVGLELGGNDPAYVRADAALDDTLDNLVDGAFFNAGQSCCAVERIYVHEAVYDTFVEGYVDRVLALQLGDPREPDTTLGPVVRASAAERIRAEVAEAVAGGARALIDPARFPAAAAGTPYLAPQVLVDVPAGAAVLREETFGPVAPIVRVGSDDEAVALMNDDAYGLTASVWTTDLDEGLRVGDRVHTGTLFLNRCDVLDPELAWVGVKDSGRGCTLSRAGYESLTRPRSVHVRLPQTGSPRS